MNIIKTKSGLEMTADCLDIKEIKDILAQKELTMISKETQFISEFLGSDPTGNSINYRQVFPEEVGALTGAPLISDGKNIYGYMLYQVSDFLVELSLGRTIIWNKG